MESQLPPQQSVFNQRQQSALPNATAILILGITSIPTACCGGIVGMICGIIALVLAKKDTALYRSMPDNFTQGSLDNLKAGKVCAIVGLSLAGLVIIYYVFIFILFGTMMITPEMFKNLSK